MTVQDTWSTHSAQDKRADRYQKQCRIHGEPIQHRKLLPTHHVSGTEKVHEMLCGV